MSDIARKVDPTLLSTIRRYGAFDITACFNCGNCTAVCPLSEEHDSFPRKMIRSGQVGIKENLVSGAEPWLCYYCGECSETCPREAEPGEYMAALRRYAIAETDPTGIAKLFYRSPLALFVLTTIVSVVLALVLLSMRHGSTDGPQWLFSNLVAYEAIHMTGITLGVISGLILIAGIVRLVTRNLKNVGGIGFLFKQKASTLFPAARSVLIELFTMKRHAECTTRAQTENPWYATPRFIHGFIMWGFLGLATATALDYVLMYLLKMDWYLPGRITGTISGLALLYGTLFATGKRFAKKEKHSQFTHAADTWLLFFLLILAITGFWLETAVFIGRAGAIHSWVLLIHSVFAMDLILLIAVTKLAHAVYRPISLFLHLLKQKGIESNV